MCPHGHSAIVETSEGKFTNASNIHILAPDKTPMCNACGDAIMDGKVCKDCFCCGCETWCGTSTQCNDCKRCLYRKDDGNQYGKESHYCDHAWCEATYGRDYVKSYYAMICKDGKELVDPCATSSCSDKVVPVWSEMYPQIASTAPHRHCTCYKRSHRAACDQCGGSCTTDCS